MFLLGSRSNTTDRTHHTTQTQTQRGRNQPTIATATTTWCCLERTTTSLDLDPSSALGHQLCLALREIEHNPHVLALLRTDHFGATLGFESLRPPPPILISLSALLCACCSELALEVCFTRSASAQGPQLVTCNLLQGPVLCQTGHCVERLSNAAHPGYPLLRRSHSFASTKVHTPSARL